MISLCMIVRDEARCLHRCLTSMIPFVDEIIVCDTGSEDNSIEIAVGLGARVVRAEWQNDFSHARNVSLEHARQPWVLVLDADEWVEHEAWESLRQMLTTATKAVFELPILNYVEQDGGQSITQHFAPRLFPRKEAYFSGIIHEQIVSSWPRKLLPEFYVHHDGYTQKVVQSKDKILRNLPLLEAEVSLSPYKGFSFYNLGINFMALGKDEEARKCFERTIKLSFPADSTPAYFTSACIQLIGLLVKQGEAESALAIAEKHFTICSDNPDFWINKGAVLTALGRYPEAIEAYTEAWEVGQKEFVTCGVYSNESIYTRPFEGIASIYNLSGQPDIARLFEEAKLEKSF